MPLIKPRTRGKQLVKHRTRLDCENNETLYAYAQFLGESTEYVLNHAASTQVPPRPEKQPSPLSVRRVGVPCSARLLKRARWSPWRCPVESVSGDYARTPFRMTMCSSV